MPSDYITMLTQIVPSLSALASLVIAILVMRNGTGQAGRALDEKIDHALQKFGALLDEKFGRRIADLVEHKTLELELNIVQIKLEKEILRIDSMLGQLDHRLTRDAEHISMLLDNKLKHESNQR